MPYGLSFPQAIGVRKAFLSSSDVSLARLRDGIVAGFGYCSKRLTAALGLLNADAPKQPPHACAPLLQREMPA
jgi:hypothetical protein